MRSSDINAVQVNDGGQSLSVKEPLQAVPLSADLLCDSGFNNAKAINFNNKGTDIII